MTNENRNKKQPSKMEDVELLEMYSHYNKMDFRVKEEQNYLGLLQQEILKRMERGGNHKRRNP